MSHFTVAVLTKNKDKLEEMLAPYSEELSVEPYIDETKEQIIENAKRYKTSIEKSFNEGKEISDYQNPYLKVESDEELYKLYIDEDEIYDEQGNHLTTYNPNSKWDWFDIGGRWRNMLLTKNENQDTFEHNSFAEHFGNYEDKREAPNGYKWVNGTKLKDICFDKMKEISGENFYTWALLNEQGWFEKGKMGWWAINNATEDSENIFVEEFEKVIKDKDNQELYLVIVDCHI